MGVWSNKSGFINGAIGMWFTGIELVAQHLGWFNSARKSGRSRGGK